MILGVIGGMGPLADSVFLRLLSIFVKGENDRDRLHVLLNSQTQTPCRNAFLCGESDLSPLPYLLDSLELLLRCGADFIAMPCNTAHFFWRDLQAKSPRKILDMIKETSLACAAKKATRVGVLATRGTILSGLYTAKLKEFGVQAVIPDEGCQKEIQKLIWSVKAGKVDGEKLEEICKKMHSECDLFVSGCTEISVVLQDTGTVFPFVDSLSVLAKTAINLSGKSCVPSVPFT